MDILVPKCWIFGELTCLGAFLAGLRAVLTARKVDIDPLIAVWNVLYHSRKNAKFYDQGSKTRNRKPALSSDTDYNL